MISILTDEDSSDDIIIDGACVGNYWSQVFEKFHLGGFNGQLVTVLGTGDLKDGIEAYKTINQIIRQNADKLIQVTNIDDIYKAKKQGKVGIIYHMQGAENLGADIGNLGIHYQLGLRVLQLAYNRRNFWCEGCLETNQNTGLSKLGRRLIAACNNQGVVIDGSHCSWGSIIEACELSEKPVICSHSSAYTLCPTYRNVSDEVIYAVADTGGVIGACSFPPFISSERPLTMKHFIDHINYISDLVGPDHVSLGLDYYYQEIGEINIQNMIGMGIWEEEVYCASLPWTWPPGLDDITTSIPNIRSALADTGFTRDEIRGILGHNLMRIFSQVWKK